ncbi:MAG: general secretion pathway protein GspK [Geminicoccaceae bacterium]|nr:general secretion pathway protein GspK [Geminicoccaceae bacterium]
MSAPASRNPRARERGAALVVVLWFAAALSALAVDLVGLRRDVGLEASVAMAQIRAAAALDSAIDIAVELVQEDGLDEEGRAALTLDGIDIVLAVTPESGRIDLNGAKEELIGALARVAIDDADHARAVAAAILDWRDDNDLRRPNGAEKSEYRRAGFDHAPADGPFRYVDELRSVLGVSEADYRALRDLVTTASGREEVDEATAPESVRRAADIAQGLVADPDDPADAAEEAEPPVFAADPAGLYTIDVRVVAADTFTRHARTLVWLQPLDAVRGYQILDHRGWLLPREAEPVKER